MQSPSDQAMNLLTTGGEVDAKRIAPQLPGHRFGAAAPVLIPLNNSVLRLDIGRTIRRSGNRADLRHVLGRAI
jgi:hypothetical protein